MQARLRDRLVPVESWQPGQAAVRSDLDLNPGIDFGARELRPAAVLIALIDRPEGVSVLLTRRADTLTKHSGQIAFAGGRLDSGETAVEAALREANEEVALDPAVVEVLGLGDAYETGTGFLITPVVGWLAQPPQVRPSEAEVADIFETPWTFLMDAANHRRDFLDVADGDRRWFWAMPWEDRYIWGATAGIIRALRVRLYGEIAA